MTTDDTNDGRDSESSAGDAPVLGLALGGGAVLGFAHIGLLKALDEAGIDIGCIAGTSAGAIAAALYAFDITPERAQEVLQPLSWRKVSGFSRTSLGLMSNEPLGDLIEDELGEDAMIEDASIPLAVSAADIHTGERVLLREGSVVTAVRASAAIPGIYTPIEIGDRLLVDGGVVENVPVLSARDLGADVVVAATLGYTLDFDEVHNLLGVLTNAFLMTVNTATRLSLQLSPPDVVIEPDLEPHNHWDMDQRDELIEKGYEAGHAAVDEIREALEKATG